VTTVGVLGPSTRRDDLDILHQWADVRWGVDSVTEAIARITSEPIDVLVSDASVAYLTEDVLKLSPSPVGRIYAIAESDGMHTWANSLTGVTAVRSVGQIVNSEVVASNALSTSPAELRGVSRVQAVETTRTIAVWGPVGSPGITTTAISLATVCGMAGLSVVLCDLDTRGSSIAVALNVTDDTPGFAAACRLAGRDELTREEIVRLCVDVNQAGVPFSVLTGLPRASRWAEVAPPKTRVVLELLSTMFDVVIIDTGFGAEDNEWVEDAPQRDGTTRAVLQLASAVIAVGGSDAVGVARIIRGLDEIREICPTPTLVLNRIPRVDWGDAVDVIHRFTDHRVAASIPADSRKGVDEALARARQNPGPWRAVARHVGITVATPRASRWRR
jgi:Mrp family chromosome partitioning ATPase